ncbi:MAG: CoA transferase [Arthrobacter sp.]|nr:CoA transferase [Arthrobacter sp.]
METMPLIRRHVEALELDPALLSGVRIIGPTAVLPSSFRVTTLATAAVAAANLGVAAVLRVAGGDAAGAAVAPGVAVDSGQACAAFLSEALFLPDGWQVPSPWDALSGVYRCRDGWIRLHTNYATHRAAALTALGLPADAGREDVALRVTDRETDELEAAVVRAGGAAAALRSRSAWLSSPAGEATAAEPAVQVDRRGEHIRWAPAPGRRPLDGLRVLDLTRVIAGPVATRFLAAHGAEVLRIDPPGFDEVPALLPITTQGKRRAFLDLSTSDGKERFLNLLREADVLVHGLRPGALDALGLTEEVFRRTAPSLVIARLDAYGWQGPWAGRRGFDSLVQMSCGIADDGGRAAAARTSAERADHVPPAPQPLPAQALDHSTGHHLAAGILALLASGRSGTVTASLIGAANLLYSLGPATPEDASDPAPGSPSPAEGTGAAGVLGAFRRPVTTFWGPAQAIPVPGIVEGSGAEFTLPAGPLGVDPPAWS